MKILDKGDKGFDWYLSSSIIVLLFFSLAGLYSFGGRPVSDRFLKQSIFIAGGLVLMMLASYIDYHWWQNWSIFAYGISILLLILVLFLGTEIRGAKGWFVFGNFSFQPAGIMEATFILIMAHFFSSNKHRQYLSTIIISLVYLIIPVALIAMEPDLGSLMVLVFLWLVFIFSSKLPFKAIIALVALIIIGGAALWFLMLATFQKDRILTFIYPGRDPLGRGYNVRQSIIAIGSGQMFGRGLGLGTQSQLNFLPEKSTDFIFAALSEELGFVGSLLLILTFFVLFWRLYGLSQKARDDFTYLLVIGILSLIAFKFVINIGMNLGLLPVTGLPLPFLSYGGSSLAASMILVGIAQSVARRH